MTFEIVVVTKPLHSAGLITARGLSNRADDVVTTTGHRVKLHKGGFVFVTRVKIMQQRAQQHDNKNVDVDALKESGRWRQEDCHTQPRLPSIRPRERGQDGVAVQVCPVELLGLVRAARKLDRRMKGCYNGLLEKRRSEKRASKELTGHY